MAFNSDNSLAQEELDKQKKYSHSQGMTLLEVVITIAIMAFLAATLYQFFGFMNKESRAQISDQEFVDRLNLFFHNIAKDFRTAETVEFDNVLGVLTINTVEGEENTYTFETSGDEVRIFKNGTKIVQGPVTKDPKDPKDPVIITCEDNGSYYTRLYLSFSTSVGNYDLSVVRRNPPADKEVD
ncbi:MAG: type pilus assembly protein PilW [Candidatus Atribacteria bacterium]|nr:type pilus assembly protein PilW [Candidatus Atribacteria bacterium]